MTGILRYKTPRGMVCTSQYDLDGADGMRWFRGVVREYKAPKGPPIVPMQAFGIVLAGLRVIIVDADGFLREVTP